MNDELTVRGLLIGVAIGAACWLTLIGGVYVAWLAVTR